MAVRKYDGPFWIPEGFTPRLMIGQTAHVYQDNNGVETSIYQTLYTDETGVTTASNPFTVDNAGNVTFYADADFVWIKVGTAESYRVQLPIEGVQGDPGADGKTVLNGSGAPANALGVDGDFYIDIDADAIYGPKTAGVWGSATSLIGPTGVAGKTVLNGAGAPAAGTGVDGDFYIDTTNNDIYGPKTSGAWGTPTSLVGPKGDPGEVTQAELDAAIATVDTRIDVIEDREVALDSFATSGSGSSGDPWLGWESAFASSRPIYMRQGFFDTNGTPIDISVPAAARGVPGDLRKGTVIRNPSSTDIFRILDGGQGFFLDGAAFVKTGVAPTAGRAVYVDAGLTSTNGVGSKPVTFRNISAYNFWDGIVAAAGNQIVVDGFVTGGIVNDGFSGLGGTDFFLSRIRIMGAGRDALRFDVTGGIYLSDVITFQPTGHGLHMLGTAKQLFAEKLIVDQPTSHGIEIRGTCFQMEFHNSWSAGSVNGYGVRVDQLTGGGGLTWSGGKIRANGLSGVLLTGSGTEYHFTGGVKLGSNGILASGSNTAGLIAAGGMSNFSITDAYMGKIPGDGTQQTIGVWVQTGASDNYIISKNRYGNEIADVNKVIDQGTGMNKYVEHIASGPRWITPTLNAGWSVVVGQQPPRYRKFGNQVIIEGIAKNTSGAGTTANVFDLDAGYRPTESLFFATYTGVALRVNSLGNVGPVSNVNADASFAVNCAFGAGA